MHLVDCSGLLFKFNIYTAMSFIHSSFQSVAMDLKRSGTSTVGEAKSVAKVQVRYLCRLRRSFEIKFSGS